MIGDDIKVTLTSSAKGRAQLSFDAPEDVPINREKIYNLLKKEGKRHINT